MKLCEIAKAYTSLTNAKKITGLTFGSIRRLVKLSDVLFPELEFLNSQELQIFEVCCDRDEAGTPLVENGNPVITERAEEARKKLIELRGTDVEIAFEPFEIPEEELQGSLPISAADVENLRPFVRFGGE